MARLAAILTRARPMAFTDQLPLIFHGGDTPIPNIGLNNVGKPALDERQVGLIAQMYKDDSLAASVAEGFHVRDEVYQSISRENTAANRGAVSPGGFPTLEDLMLSRHYLKSRQDRDRTLLDDKDRPFGWPLENTGRCDFVTASSIPPSSRGLSTT